MALPWFLGRAIAIILLRRQLEKRLAFDNGVIVGECVECLNQQAAVTSLEIDIADGAQAHTPIGIELMKEARSLSIAGQLPLESPEHFGLDWLELEADFVRNISATLHLIGMLPFEAMGKEAAMHRQRIMRGSRDFGERQAGITPRQHVTCAGNVDLCLIIASLNLLRVHHLE